MKTINADIYWSRKNYCCGWGYDGFGAVLVTDKSFDGVKKAFLDALNSQVNDMSSVGEYVPEWLENGEYKVMFNIQTSALLRNAEQFTTMAVISRVTGINQKLLSNYASSVKIPRPAQKQKIVDGLHQIGRAFLTM